MANIIYRGTKGSPLTNSEVDSNFNILHNNTSGAATIPLSANYTIDTNSPTESDNFMIEFTGTLTASVTVTFPSGKSKGWIVKNNTTGGFFVYAKISGDATVIPCPPALWTSIFSYSNSMVLHPGQFESGTRLSFAQASAPTGWTQDTSDNATNRMLRVVNTAGNGVGGSHSPILNNVVPSHTHAFTTSSDAHTHTYTSPAYTGGNSTFYISGSTGTSAKTGTVTSSDSHNHTGTTNANGSSSNWTPRYIDLIICAKN